MFYSLQDLRNVVSMPMPAPPSPVVLTYSVMTYLLLRLLLEALHVRNVLKELQLLSLLDDVKVAIIFSLSLIDLIDQLRLIHMSVSV